MTACDSANHGPVAAAPTWHLVSSTMSPPRQSGSSAADDLSTREVVLFGGFNNRVFLDQTWTWNGATWAEDHPSSSPPPRENASMAYDEKTGTVVLFGGMNQSGDLNDTWIWNGATWAEDHPLSSPPPRENASMAYDEKTGTVVLFGGGNSESRLDDTWVWNGSTWTRLRPSVSPSFRTQASMAYDAKESVCVLFGGLAPQSPSGLLGDTGETWIWNGSTWTEEHPLKSPSARENIQLTYDARLNAVLLFGGLSIGGPNLSGPINDSVKNAGDHGDTWIWNGSNWMEMHLATAPSARDAGVLVYDQADGDALLFGGSNSKTESLFDQSWNYG